MSKKPTTKSRSTKPAKKSATPKPAPKAKKVANQYDNGDYNYLRYWDHRAYEHASEEMAIKRLLKGKRFKTAADIGGGYGRLCIFLQNYADKVTLAEPSKQQLNIAKDFLKDHPKIDQVLTQADDLKLKDNSQELITMIRVMHHLPDPSEEFAEIRRVLADDGVFILELANNAHGRNRLKYALKGKKVPRTPVDIRSAKNRNDNEPAFVNHHPRTVVKQLAHAGLKVDKVLSVSNLRSPGLKKVIPRTVMLGLEKIMQPTLARTYFGPSVFFLIRKAK
ncbi:class I SAM-dependent methyltransferase [Patescibacteria group bacterium]|nr:MAG: class I SAM-dependent methyltransferase [Patescibacteria group bacterium]